MANEKDAVYGETFQLSFVLGKRRVHPRYPLDAPVEFIVEGAIPAEPSSADVRDISLGGIGVTPPETDGARLPQIGARVRLHLSIEGIKEPIKAEGVVVHANPQKGFGVRFQSLTSEVRMRLKRLITSKVQS